MPFRCVAVKIPSLHSPSADGLAGRIERTLNELRADKSLSFSHQTKYSITTYSLQAALITWYDHGPIVNDE